MTEYFYRRTHITSTPFENPYIKKTIDGQVRLQGVRRSKPPRIVDPFARESWLTTKPQGVNGITNDLDPTMPTDHHLEARDFAQLMYDSGETFDLILWDPPYNLSQLKRRYDGLGKDLELWQTLNPFGEAKDLLAKCLDHGGSIVSLGFGSQGFGKHRGVDKIQIHNLEPSGTEWRYNVQMVIERKLQYPLTGFVRAGEIEEE